MHPQSMSAFRRPYRGSFGCSQAEAGEFDPLGASDVSIRHPPVSGIDAPEMSRLGEECNHSAVNNAGATWGFSADRQRRESEFPQPAHAANMTLYPINLPSEFGRLDPGDMAFLHIMFDHDVRKGMRSIRRGHHHVLPPNVQGRSGSNDRRPDWCQGGIARQH
jgi:hypothetical protein